LQALRVRCALRKELREAAQSRRMRERNAIRGCMTSLCTHQLEYGWPSEPVSEEPE